MIDDRRFLRTKALLGEDGLSRLNNAHVMIIGLGAVGGYALEAIIIKAGGGESKTIELDRKSVV